LVANEEAIYRASNLLAGDYEITASAPNFTSFLQKGVTLTVGADLTIDLKLTAGAVTASIIVSDEAPTVDTTTPTIGAVVNERTIVSFRSTGATGRASLPCSQGFRVFEPNMPAEEQPRVATAAMETN